MPAITNKNNLLIYKGSSYLRQRLVQSTLSGKSVKIIEIRSNADEPGLREFEVSLIRLLDKITNGSIVELNETGTSLFYQPGLLYGGNFHHDCSLQRGIGYYLEVLLMLGVFCKLPLNITLRGITNNNIDPSVDHLKVTGLATLRKFLLDDEGLDIKICNRGMLPLGGGEVVFKCPIRKNLRPIQFIDPGMVKRIRGTSFALRISPANANRMIDTAKGVVLKFIPDVYINSDQCKGKQSGKSPGFGISLIAETTNGVFYCAEKVSNVTSEGEEPSVPEDLGVNAAQRLLTEIYYGGCVDSACQSLAILLMALGQKDVSKIMIGPLSECAISFLQHLKEFFGVTFKIEHFKNSDDDEDEVRGSDKVLLTCVGIGYTNLSKKNI